VNSSGVRISFSVSLCVLCVSVVYVSYDYSPQRHKEHEAHREKIDAREMLIWDQRTFKRDRWY
jgi:hypothetical protein